MRAWLEVGLHHRPTVLAAVARRRQPNLIYRIFHRWVMLEQTTIFRSVIDVLIGMTNELSHRVIETKLASAVGNLALEWQVELNVACHINRPTRTAVVVLKALVLLEESLINRPFQIARKEQWQQLKDIVWTFRRLQIHHAAASRLFHQVVQKVITALLWSEARANGDTDIIAPNKAYEIVGLHAVIAR